MSAEEFMPFLTPTGTAENSDYINAVFLPVHIYILRQYLNIIAI